MDCQPRLTDISLSSDEGVWEEWEEEVEESRFLSFVRAALTSSYCYEKQGSAGEL